MTIVGFQLLVEEVVLSGFPGYNDRLGFSCHPKNLLVSVGLVFHGLRLDGNETNCQRIRLQIAGGWMISTHPEVRSSWIMPKVVPLQLEVSSSWFIRPCTLSTAISAIAGVVAS